MARSAIGYLQADEPDGDAGEESIAGARGFELVAIVRDTATRDIATRDTAARDTATRDTATRDTAARDTATRDTATRETAPRETVARDVHDPAGGGLGEALGRIAADEASTLLAPRLGALAGSLRELVALLDWLEAAGADLVALDAGLDTGSPGGRRTVGVLREIDRLEREPRPGRPPRGRPGLATHAPLLGERIVAMRERGLSLQAIADTLNAEDVPTPRGGARWRPSSVQAALGYRRPRPPVPGPPPPPPPGHPPRGPSPRGPSPRGHPPGGDPPRGPSQSGAPRARAGRPHRDSHSGPPPDRGRHP